MTAITTPFHITDELACDFLSEVAMLDIHREVIPANGEVQTVLSHPENFPTTITLPDSVSRTYALRIPGIIDTPEGVLDGEGPIGLDFATWLAYYIRDGHAVYGNEFSRDDHGRLIGRAFTVSPGHAPVYADCSDSTARLKAS